MNKLTKPDQKVTEGELVKNTLKTEITFFDKRVVIACDQNCNKAWGINLRQRNQLSDNIDDYEYLADSELEDAPVDPGSYEGGYGKPFTPHLSKPSTPPQHNKWCARECERSSIFDVGEEIILRDFTKRVSNIVSSEFQHTRQLPLR